MLLVLHPQHPLIQVHILINEDYNSSAKIWSSIEANLATICPCLPPLRSLIGRVLPGGCGWGRSSRQEKASLERSVGGQVRGE